MGVMAPDLRKRTFSLVKRTVLSKQRGSEGESQPSLGNDHRPRGRHSGDRCYQHHVTTGESTRLRAKWATLTRGLRGPPQTYRRWIMNLDPLTCGNTKNRRSEALKPLTCGYLVFSLLSRLASSR